MMVVDLSQFESRPLRRIDSVVPVQDRHSFLNVLELVRRHEHLLLMCDGDQIVDILLHLLHLSWGAVADGITMTGVVRWS